MITKKQNFTMVADELQRMKTYNGVKITPGMRFVYLAILKHQFHKASRCYASVETLAKESGTSRRTVQRAVRRLCAAGLVTCKERAIKGKTLTNVYVAVDLLEDKHESRLSHQVGASNCRPKKNKIYNNNINSISSIPDEKTETVEPVEPVEHIINQSKKIDFDILEHDPEYADVDRTLIKKIKHYCYTMLKTNKGIYTISGKAVSGKAVKECIQGLSYKEFAVIIRRIMKNRADDSEYTIRSEYAYFLTAFWSMKNPETHTASSTIKTNTTKENKFINFEQRNYDNLESLIMGSI